MATTKAQKDSMAQTLPQPQFAQLQHPLSSSGMRACSASKGSSPLSCMLRWMQSAHSCMRCVFLNVTLLGTIVAVMHRRALCFSRAKGAV